MLKAEDESLDQYKSEKSLVSSEIKFSDTNNTTTVLIEEL